MSDIKFATAKPNKIQGSATEWAETLDGVAKPAAHLDPLPVAKVSQELQTAVEQFLYRQAEILDDKHWDEWLELFTADGRAVASGSGSEMVPDCGIAEVKFCPTVLVVAGNQPTQHLSRGLLAWLRRLDRHGTLLGAIDTGAFALAAAGLLDGYRITLHWEAVQLFHERHPEIEVVEQLFSKQRHQHHGEPVRLLVLEAVIARDVALRCRKQDDAEDTLVHGDNVMRPRARASLRLPFPRRRDRARFPRQQLQGCRKALSRLRRSRRGWDT